MANRYSDKHTVFITELGCTNTKQLNWAIENYIRMYSKKLNKPREFWGSWYTNLLGNGVAYVFFDKTETYYIMLGKNVDGEDFFDEVPNPEYEEWQKNEDDFLNAPLDLSSSVSWSDASDAPPKTIKSFIEGPLIEFPIIKLDDSQLRIGNVSEIKINIRNCVVYEPEETCDRNTLFACNVSSEITDKDIALFFKRFVTSTIFKEPKVTLVKQKSATSLKDDDWRSTSQKTKKETYSNKVFVKFDSDTNDAMFAFIMARKCKIRGKDLCFKYSNIRSKEDRNKPRQTMDDTMRSMYYA